MAQTLTVSVSAIVLDPRIQPRETLDQAHIKGLVEAMQSAEDVPAIAVVSLGDSYVLVDGWHRLAAFQQLGLDSCEVEALPMPSDGDLLSLAFSLNARHGKPLTLRERRAEAVRLLQTGPSQSDRFIASRVGLAPNTVGSLRRGLVQGAQIEQLATRTGSDGRSYQLPQRKPGELPERGVGGAVRDFFRSGTKEQRKLTSYLERLSTALEEQFDVPCWETHRQAAEAIIAVKGEAKAQELAEELGPGAVNVLYVVRLLGYDPKDGDE